MLESMEQEKKRQVNRLEGEIQRRRERKERRRREQLETEEALAVRADDEEEQRGVDQVNTEEAKQLQTKLARTRRPSTPTVVIVTETPPPPGKEEPMSKKVVRQDSLTVPEAVPLEASFDINKLIMNTPLFSQISEIETLLQTQLVSNSSPPSSDNHIPYIDVRDAQWECKGQIVPTDVLSLKPVDFVVYQFGIFSSHVLHIRNQLPKIPILIASNLPSNNYDKNCFRNSFFYDHPQGILFIREDRLGSIGEFVSVVLHCLCHIKCGDLTDDGQPVFLREFYSVSQIWLCSVSFAWHDIRRFVTMHLILYIYLTIFSEKFLLGYIFVRP